MIRSMSPKRVHSPRLGFASRIAAKRLPGLCSGASCEKQPCDLETGLKWPFAPKRAVSATAWEASQPGRPRAWEAAASWVPLNWVLGEAGAAAIASAAFGTTVAPEAGAGGTFSSSGCMLCTSTTVGGSG